MTWAAAAFVVAAFLVLAKWFRVPALAQAVFGHSRRAIHALRDPGLGEREKERLARTHAAGLTWLFVRVTLASGAAILLPFAVIALLDVAGVVTMDDVAKRTTSPAFLLVATALGSGAVVVLRRRHR